MVRQWYGMVRHGTAMVQKWYGMVRHGTARACSWEYSIMRMSAPWLEAKPVRSTNTTTPPSGGGRRPPRAALSPPVCCMRVVPEYSMCILCAPIRSSASCPAAAESASAAYFI